MKILLLNDNPVVTKLVTLSAQKSGNEILIADSIEAISKGAYDLLIVDEGMYSEEKMEALKESIRYKYSLYMLSRGSASVTGFDDEIKKPFLPTDLVELLSTIAVEVSSFIDAGKTGQEDSVIDDNFNLDEELNKNLSIDEEKIDALDFDELDFNLDELDLEELTPNAKEDEVSILDKDDVQEVKDLLEETELDDEEFNFDDLDLNDATNLMEEEPLELTEAIENDELQQSEDEFDFSDLGSLQSEEIQDLGDESPQSKDEDLDPLMDEALNMIDENFAFEDHEEEDIMDESDDTDFTKAEESLEDEELNLNLSDLDGFEDEKDEKKEEYLTLDDLENKIESAVAELSEEDLDKELDIPLDELEGLDEKSLKLALGEEIEEEFVEPVVEDKVVSPEIVPVENVKEETHNNGVDALKALLKALENEEVVATLKGMNVNINISFGNASDK